MVTLISTVWYLVVIHSGAVQMGSLDACLAAQQHTKYDAFCVSVRDGEIKP